MALHVSAGLREVQIRYRGHNPILASYHILTKWKAHQIRLLAAHTTRAVGPASCSSFFSFSSSSSTLLVLWYVSTYHMSIRPEFITAQPVTSIGPERVTKILDGTLGDILKYFAQLDTV